MALTYKVFGTDPLWISWVQSLLDAGTCVFVALIAYGSFGVAAGWGAGVLSALYRPMVFFTAPLLKETLSLFVLAAGLYYFFRSRHRFLSGLFLGMAVVARPNLAPVIVLMAFLARPNWRLFLVAAVLPLTLTLAHNWSVSHVWVPITYSGGFNFYIGYHDGASASNSYPESVSTDPIDEEKDTTRLAEGASGRKLDPAEISAYWLAQGRKWVFENPGTAFNLFLERALLAVSQFEVPDNYDQNFIREQFTTLLNWLPISFAALFALFSAGWYLRRAERETQWLVYMALAYLLSIMLFYVTDRYRLPLVIFMFPLAGAAFSRLLLRPRPVMIAACALGLSFLPWRMDASQVTGFNRGLLATLYAEKGEDSEAFAALKPALENGAGGVSAQALIRTGEALERSQQLLEAERLFLLATVRFPSDGLAFHNYGRFKLDHGDASAAERLFRQSIAVAPWLYQPYIGLAATALRLGNKGMATQAISDGERIAPGRPEFARLRAMVKAAP